MADLPVASDQGAQPVVINDPVTAANVATVTAAGSLKVDGSAVIQPIDGGTIAESTAAWTSATALNAAVTIIVTGYTSVFVTLNQTSTITGGIVTFEVSDTTGFTNAYPVTAAFTNDPDFGTTYVLVASTNQAFYVNVRGAAAFRVRLSTTISGTGTVNVGIQANSLPGDPIVSGEVNAELYDAAGNAITSSTVGSKQPLDVNIIQNSATNPSADNIAALVLANEVYTVSTSINMTSSGVENPLLLITNPGANTKILYIYSLSLGLILANNAADFELYASPTITTNGTLQTPQSNYVGGGAPASVMNIYTLPTVSSNGAEMGDFFYGQNQNSINFLANLSIAIKPGNSILLTGNPINSNNRPANITLVWVEQ